jgi:hypothetical protein
MDNAEARRVRRVHCAARGQESVAEMKGGGRGCGIGGSHAGRALQLYVKPWEAQQSRPASRLHQPIHSSVLDDANDRRPPTIRRLSCDTLPQPIARLCPPAKLPPRVFPSLCDAGTAPHTAAHHRIACLTAQRLPPCHGAVGHMASLRGSFTPTAASARC